MAGQVFLANVGLGLGDQANESLPIKNPHQTRANQFTRNGQCRTSVEFTGKNHFETQTTKNM
jgi:hypothetical protein